MKRKIGKGRERDSKRETKIRIMKAREKRENNTWREKQREGS